MSLFKKASKKNRRLKMLVYGGPGTGKTIFALTFPNVRIVDIEGGVLQYEERVVVPEIGQSGEFEKLATGSAMKVLDGVEETFDDFVRHARDPKVNPKPCDTFVVDPMTKFWERLQEAYTEEEKRGSGRFKSGTTLRDWGSIKRPLKNMITDLQNLPVHFLMIAHSGDKMEGQGQDMKVVGTKANTEKSAPYAVDTVLEFMEQKRGGGTIVKCHKDRTGVMKVGEIYENVSFGMWSEYLASSGGESAETIEREDTSRDGKLFDAPAADSGKPANETLVGEMLGDPDVVKFLEEMDWPEAKRRAQAMRFDSMENWKKYVGTATREFRAAREKKSS